MAFQESYLVKNSIWIWILKNISTDFTTEMSDYLPHISNTLCCVLCNKDIDFNNPETHSKLTEKGCASINKATSERGEERIQLVFSENEPQFVHSKCRDKHTNSKYIKLELKNKSKVTKRKRTLRSEILPFDHKTCCILCGIFVDKAKSKKYPDRLGLQYSCVLCLEVKDTLEKHCSKRQDDWAEVVNARLLTINDLLAAEAIYCRDCFRAFINGKDIPRDKQNNLPVPCKKPKLLGRPKLPSKVDAFKLAVGYLEENDDETVTIEHLYAVMKNKSGLPDDDLYSTRQLKRELQNHYGNKVSMTTKNQQPTVVTLTSNVKTIIQEAHKNASESTENNMDALIETVGEYIRRKIKCMKKHDNVYPDADEVGSTERNVNYLPHSLHLLLQTMIKSYDSELKIASIGQAKG